jgi:hypothetical protein
MLLKQHPVLDRRAVEQWGTQEDNQRRQSCPTDEQWLFLRECRPKNIHCHRFARQFFLGSTQRTIFHEILEIEPPLC